MHLKKIQKVRDMEVKLKDYWQLIDLMVLKDC